MAKTSAKTPAKSPNKPGVAQSPVRSRAQAGAPARPAVPPPVEDDGDDAWPCTKYRKVPTSDRWPNGYEARQFKDAAAWARADKKVWKDDPESALGVKFRTPAQESGDEFDE